ncbi:hypothetical protein ACT4UM_18750, partial [Bacillus sp. SS-TM]
MGKIAAIFRFQQARRDAAYSRRKNYDVVSLFARGGEAPRLLKTKNCGYFTHQRGGGNQCLH